MADRGGHGCAGRLDQRRNRRGDDGSEFGCHVAGGHSVDDPEPKYGMAVTGIADPEPSAATSQ